MNPRDACVPPQAGAGEDDVDLALRAADGCTASFAILTARHEVAIVHYLRQSLSRRGGPRACCDAEDVAQETFLRAWRELRRFDPRHSFPAWLFTIGRRTCLNHLRGERRHAHRLARAARARKSDREASDTIAPAEDGPVSLLWNLAARTLSERQFTALWLRYVEEMPTAEIARVLASTTVGVRLTLMRGRRRLEAALRAAEAGAADRSTPTTVPLAPLLRPLPPPAS